MDRHARAHKRRKCRMISNSCRKARSLVSDEWVGTVCSIKEIALLCSQFLSRVIIFLSSRFALNGEGERRKCFSSHG